MPLSWATIYNPDLTLDLHQSWLKNLKKNSSLQNLNLDCYNATMTYFARLSLILPKVNKILLNFCKILLNPSKKSLKFSKYTVDFNTWTCYSEKVGKCNCDKMKNMGLRVCVSLKISQHRLCWLCDTMTNRSFSRSSRGLIDARLIVGKRQVIPLCHNHSKCSHVVTVSKRRTSFYL